MDRQFIAAARKRALRNPLQFIYVVALANGPALSIRKVNTILDTPAPHSNPA
jgi:hypothetical protein